MLPDMSGLQICKKLSDNEETSNIPVIILTSRNDEYDILNSFDFGCSDYVTKPFNEKILVARIKACLSLRKKLCYSKGYGYDDKKIIKFNTLSIDPSRYEVKIKNKLIDLTPLEFKLFYFLAKNQE
jgi:DNA-binding response OmpR family regulator